MFWIFIDIIPYNILIVFLLSSFFVKFVVAALFFSTSLTYVINKNRGTLKLRKGLL